MFLNIPSPLRYTDPWSIGQEQRMRQLLAQDRRIAYFYERPDTSTFRYRAMNPGLTLAANPGCGVSGAWFDHQDLATDDSFLDSADALVICRTRYNAAVASMIARARARRLPVLFDCDDLVFDTRRLHLLVDSLNQDPHSETVWNDWFASIGRIGATLRLCDGFITTNAFLAARAREYMPQLSTAVMPNYLFQGQQELSEGLHQIKRDGGWRRDGHIHVGYFSGSPSHARDFAVAAPAILRLMERDPRIILRIVGFLDPSQELMRFRDRIEFHPLQDFMNLQRLIAEVEINIAPLQDNTFTNCKSELKFFEAAICGTLTLATPTFTFRNSIRHGETGYLVPAYGWDAALQEAVALVEDTDRYAAIAEAASTQVRADYGWDRQAQTIVEAVFGQIGRSAQPADISLPA
ncbi:glycosyltransferase [Pseudoroseomonas globiformis]|uniref:Glycosyltransferase n=1 Tax=Teichococcus globiformis TaxID=2307229 RepID=A0ABV7G3H4_9PROT